MRRLLHAAWGRFWDVRRYAVSTKLLCACVYNMRVRACVMLTRLFGLLVWRSSSKIDVRDVLDDEGLQSLACCTNLPSIFMKSRHSFGRVYAVNCTLHGRK